MKNSFLLYHDNKEIFDSLSNEQSGILIKAIFEYETTGSIPELDVITRIAFIPIKQTLDRNNEKYDKIAERNKENISKRWNTPDTKNTTGKTGITEDTKNTDNDNGNDSVPDNEKEKERESTGASAPPAHDKPVRHKRGEYGWVMITDDECERLTAEYGENTVNYYIAYIDEYAQSTQNKNKYKDWNLVIRKAIREKWGNYDAHAPPVNARESKTIM